MIYLICGNQLPVVKKTLSKTLNSCIDEKMQDEFNVEKISLTDTLVQEMVFSCRSLPLGSDHKVVIASNPYFLIAEKGKPSIDKDQDYDSLIEYLNNPSSFCDLIFVSETTSLDKRSKIYKLLEEKAKIIITEEVTSSSLKVMGKSIFMKKQASISDEALDELCLRCGDDVSKFINESNKLSLYKNNIKLEDVKLMVPLKLEDNVFNIMEALVNKNTAAALKTYNDLKINKQDPVALIAILTSQFRFMDEVSFLINQGYSVDDCARELDAKPFRVKKTITSLRNISKKRIMSVLDKLYQLDLSIKSGNADPDFAFELFLVNFNN